MKKYLPLLAIIVFGIIVRYYHNIDISIWHDEAFSALLVKYPFAEMMHRIGLDVHPPMYYIFLRAWYYVFGDSVLALRSFTIFFSALLIPLAWKFVKDIFKNERAALFAALLVAINPFMLREAVTEARMYTFGAFFGLLSAYFLVKAFQHQSTVDGDKKLNMPNLPQDISATKKMLWYYAGFIFATAITMYTHYYLMFSAGALGLYGFLYLIHRYKGEVRQYAYYVGSWILIIVLYIPWVKTLLFQVKQVGAGYWIPPMDRWSVPQTLWQMLIGVQTDLNAPYTKLAITLATLFTLFFLWRFLRKVQHFEKWLVIMAILAPFAGSIMFYLLTKLKGSGTSVFIDRYFLYASTFYTIALAVWLAEIGIKRLSTALFVIYAVANFWAVMHYWSNLDVQTKPGMNGAAKYIYSNAEPNHKVFVGTSFEYFNYKYYNQQYYPTPTPPKLYTGGRSDISQISHVEGVAILTNQDLEPDFKKDTKRGDTVWLVWTYAFGSNKPETPKSWTQIDQKEFPEVRPYTGASVYVTEYKVN